MITTNRIEQIKQDIIVKIMWIFTSQYKNIDCTDPSSCRNDYCVLRNSKRDVVILMIQELWDVLFYFLSVVSKCYLREHYDSIMLDRKIRMAFKILRMGKW